MKFIDVNSARKLQMDTPVLVKDADGVVNWGKLVKEEKTPKGIERTFELAVFIIEGQPPALKPLLANNITFIAIP